MRSISSELERRFRDAIRDAFGIDADPLIAPAQNERFGDYQSNAAMGLAKAQKSNPHAVAEQILAKLDLGELTTEKPSIAGPGFINVRLSPAWLAKRMHQIASDERLGVERVSAPQNVVIDYSSPNIAKEMHVGHIRSTIIGDALARVIGFQGHNVIPQNHIGDWGTQFGMLITHLRSAPPSTAGTDPHIADLESFYRDAKKRFDEDPAFAEDSRKTVVRLQRGEPDERALWQRMVEETRNHYQSVYNRLGVLLKPEHERGESSYNSMLAQVVAELRTMGLAQESEGAVVVPVKGYEAPLIIEKSGGGYLYGTTDLAAVRYRVEQLHADRIIYLVDARQSQHFAQVFVVARRAGWAPQNVSLEHAAFGTMLGPDKRPFKTRSGEVVKLKDLLDEAVERAAAIIAEKDPQIPEDQRQAIAHAVGIAAIKYADLSKDRVSDYVFSWEQMLSFEGNTAPYLQNAYVRIRSIFRRAGAEPDASLEIRLDSAHEQSLAKHVARFDDVVDLVARELKPHHLTTYLFDLATKFHAFYEHCPVLQSEPALRTSRLALCGVTARTLAQGLELLGIEHPERM